MFTKFALFTSILAITAQAQTVFQIQSPASLIECQPASLTFTNGAEAPYYIAVLPGGQPSAAALEQLPVVQSSPVTWTVDLAAGTNVSLKITDGKGNIAYSSAVVIQAGSSTSCLAASSGSSASASASAGAASASGSSTATGSARSSGSGTAIAAAASASASSTGAGFTTSQVSAGVAALGLVVAAFGITA